MPGINSFRLDQRPFPVVTPPLGLVSNEGFVTMTGADKVIPRGVVGGLDDRVALITGAGGDIGKAVARRLAVAGARLALLDLPSRHDQLVQCEAECRELNAEVVVERVGCDVTDEAGVVAAVDAVCESLGVPDTVFNNAGYQGLFANTVDYPAADFRAVLDVNVTGVFLVLQACASVLRAAGKPGSIVNTASMAGVGGPPNMVAYAASKSAVIGMTKTAAADLAAHSIRVNAISPAFIGPGAMWTRQVELQAEVASQYYPDDPSAVAEAMIGDVPLRRYGTLDEVAAGALFLLSDQASYLTGFNLEIAGGIR